jgi:apolipoprotein N-acyltransferase
MAGHDDTKGCVGVGVCGCGLVWVCVGVRVCVCVCVGAWVCACVLGRAVKLARCSSAACLRRLLCFLVLWDRDVSHVSRAARHVRGRLAETEPEVRV